MTGQTLFASASPVFAHATATIEAGAANIPSYFVNLIYLRQGWNRSINMTNYHAWRPDFEVAKVIIWCPRIKQKMAFRAKKGFNWKLCLLK